MHVRLMLLIISTINYKETCDILGKKISNCFYFLTFFKSKDYQILLVLVNLYNWNIELHSMNEEDW